VRSEGRFIRTLFDRPLPRDLDYTLFFGHGGGYSLLRSANTDGAITLASELRPAAQAEARTIKGFDEDHVGILSSPEVFRQYALALAAADKTSAAPSVAGQGKLRVAFDYHQQDGAPQSQPALLLTPLDTAQQQQQQQIVLPIRSTDNGSELGPFPPGRYAARLFAYGFKTSPERLAVTISPGAVPRLRFSLAPQGVFSGYIGAEVKAGDNPAGSYRMPRPDIQIESITFANRSDTRRLAADDSPDDRTIEAYLAGQDYAHRSSFSFVGLAEGDYELTLKATGYQPYRKTYRVVPGQYVYIQPIDLTPMND
jgi:hypothetical protein